MLTKKQRDLLIFIHERMSSGEIAPSFEEMKQALGLKSKSGVHRLISALVERGYLERLPHRARALEVKKLPEGYTSNSENDNRSPPYANQSQSIFENIHSSIIETIPLLGKIAAGTPIEAIRNEGESLEIPASMLSGNGEHYALKVDGDSMVNVGINDQDIVIIKKSETASNGEIVVALVDDEEVTLKRIKIDGPQITLIPENDDYDPKILESSRVKVQGKLIGLYRTYH
jgi:repressor LexA